MASGDADSDSLSSSSSSDDEFLTLGGGTGADSQDREALIRKKLLESFYGKTVPEEGPPRDNDDSSSSSESDNEKLNSSMRGEEMGGSNDSNNGGVSKGNEDLDSPYFDADTHTSRHVLGSSVHTLLETEEQLALEVRTLDSTMQTLVYENYSKFIDATDAIRSIGVSVNANEDGLARLSRGMQTIDDQSRSVEDALGSLRDAVAEKLRVKRLLTRLDTLLKLPTTLKEHVANGKYRLAAKSYLSASSILSKHSSGFESLKSIETECNVILTDTVRLLKRKLVHWSGQRDDILDMSEAEDDFGGNANLEPMETPESSPGWTPPPEPPQTVSEIFECAGTLVMVLPNEKDGADTSSVAFESGLSGDDCKSMALASSMRLLDRILDSHHIELQEAKFSSIGAADTSFETALSGMTAPQEGEFKENSRGDHLIPTSYLDSLLEAATLYGMSFCVDKFSDDDRERIIDFVSEAFGSFLGHVRTVLLDHSILSEADENVDERDESVDHVEGDLVYGETSAAMAHLLRSVRNLASGLALPEVGVDVEVASSLVDQAVEVTEAMVRRRVAQKFFALRVRVIKDCLGPFAKQALVLPGEGDKTSTARVVDVVQMASVALSDGMQLVDDVVRAILSNGDSLGSSATAVDFSMVKQAVLTSARRFAVWLASTLEVLAGCEKSDTKHIVEVTDAKKDEEESEDYDEEKEETTNLATGSIITDMSDVSDPNDAASEKVESALIDVLADLDNEETLTVISDLTLAIAEMCRLAERSVMENINQAIASSDGGSKKSKSIDGIFSSAEPSRSQPSNFEEEESVSERFRLAASRVLALYAMNRGSEAASIACCGLYDMASSEGNGIPGAPRSAAWQVLEIAKMTSIDCANVFGCEKRAGPVPALSNDDVKMSPLKRNITGSSTMSSLQLDVERMFTEKVAIYPHPSDFMDFSRNAVVTILFKVAFKAMFEIARTCTFTKFGYQQLQVDIEFLRCFVPHFVKDDFMYDGTNACNILYNLLDDVMMNAGERCRDPECVGVEEYYDSELSTTQTPRSIVVDFVEASEGGDGASLTSRFTITED